MKDALLLVFANKQDLQGGKTASPIFMGFPLLTPAQLCDPKKSPICCSWRRLQKTTCGKSSPAVRPQARVSLKAWYVPLLCITPVPRISPNHATVLGMALQQRQAALRRQVVPLSCHPCPPQSPYHPSCMTACASCCTFLFLSAYTRPRGIGVP